MNPPYKKLNKENIQQLLTLGLMGESERSFSFTTHPGGNFYRTVIQDRIITDDDIDIILQVTTAVSLADHDYLLEELADLLCQGDTLVVVDKLHQGDPTQFTDMISKPSSSYSSGWYAIYEDNSISKHIILFHDGSNSEVH